MKDSLKTLFVFLFTGVLMLTSGMLRAADSPTEEILKMIAAKLPDETILLQVRNAGKPINFSADDLIKLKCTPAPAHFGVPRNTKPA